MAPAGELAPRPPVPEPSPEMADLLRIIAAIQAMKPQCKVWVTLWHETWLPAAYWAARVESPPGTESEYIYSREARGQTPAEALRALHAVVRGAAQAKVLEAARLLAAGDL